METLKRIGYVVAASILVLLFLSGGAALLVFLAIGGVVISIVGVIAFVAYSIKEYCEQPANSKDPTK